jgi:hypothetical protein
LKSESTAYSGRLREAREISRPAADSAEQAGETEETASYISRVALREALFGNREQAKRVAALALRRSTGRDVEYGVALTLAYSGDNQRTGALIADLAARFPEDTLVQFNYLPTLRAKLVLNRGKSSEAIVALVIAAPYELGATTASSYGWNALYPVFVRGETYLGVRKGEEAAAEFQKILDHHGVVGNEPIGALAHLGLARAYALQGEISTTRAAYQDFLGPWKDSDPDIPVLKEARTEYGRLR